MAEFNLKKPKVKLKSFKHFVSALMPHEIDFLAQKAKFTDSTNQLLFEQIKHAVNFPEHAMQFDETLDKRKYNYMKNWISKQLASIDVDQQFKWMHYLDEQIMTDQISQEEELQLIGHIKKYTQSEYYFIRFYELAQNYRNYLLIRMRISYLSIVSAFIKEQRHNYQEALEINHLLHDATNDIVNQYITKTSDSRQWEQKLIDIFYDSSLDGLNRYYAIVRLTFIYYNYKEFHKLTRLYNDLDQLIISGQIYSKRILVNYYANRLLLHSRYNELDKAAYYGYLSIKVHSSDYLFYVNNLSGILLRRDKTTEALQLMEDNLCEFKQNISPHTRIGFVSYYVKSLNQNGKHRKALRFSQHFMDQHIKDILNYRWRMFFMAYFETLLALKMYAQIIMTHKKHKLHTKEALFMEYPDSLPGIDWYYQLALYKEGNLDINQFKMKISGSLRRGIHKRYIPQLQQLIGILRPHIPELVRFLDNITKNSKYDLTSTN
ncbi:MAG: hypothetical protein RBR87_12565 [Bacteroidales bacterium]|jgi:hypothetical protein|nr:hypothetical protein [Bacteroidales bacterium]